MEGDSVRPRSATALIIAAWLMYVVALLVPAYAVKFLGSFNPFRGFEATYFTPYLWHANAAIFLLPLVLVVKRPWVWKAFAVAIPVGGLSAAVLPPLLVTGYPLLGHALWLCSFCVGLLGLIRLRRAGFPPLRERSES